METPKTFTESLMDRFENIANTPLPDFPDTHFLRKIHGTRREYLEMLESGYLL